MTLVLGIDPGTSGAFAVYDSVTRRLVGPVQDMPIWYQTVGKRKRKRVDPMTIVDMFDEFELMGVGLIVMEAVSARGGEGGPGAFAFGYGVGCVYMAAFYSGIPIETTPPQTWKQLLRVSGKSKADDTAILQRADELFPDDRMQFRGPKGGKKIDRAEASMIAKFGAEHILRELNDDDHRTRAARAETGA